MAGRRGCVLISRARGRERWDAARFPRGLGPGAGGARVGRWLVVRAPCAASLSSSPQAEALSPRPRGGAFPVWTWLASLHAGARPCRLHSQPRPGPARCPGRVLRARWVLKSADVTRALDVWRRWGGVAAARTKGLPPLRWLCVALRRPKAQPPCDAGAGAGLASLVLVPGCSPPARGLPGFRVPRGAPSAPCCPLTRGAGGAPGGKAPWSVLP